MWFKDELKLAEDDRIHLFKLDGSRLMLLQSPQAVASQCPLVLPASQVFIARSVVDVLRKWDAPEQQVAAQRPVGVKEGDDAQLSYFPRELSRNYVPLKVLGVGSFGVVVSADRVEKGSRKYTVAIKLVYSGGGPSGFPEKAARRLDREATLLGRVKSPYIVKLHEYGFSKANDVFWLIMEHLEGSSLDIIMRDPDMRFQEEHVVSLALQLLTGLAELHKCQVIHRDIKPANIVLGANGPSIIDLGAAAVLDLRDAEVNQSLVTQGTVLNFAGTHGFMPPEAYRDRENIGRHSDIFALAATLYFLLSGRMPFQAQDEFGWMFAVAGNMEEQAPRLTEVCSGVSSGLSDVIAKGLHKKIANRYSDCADMKQDLEDHIKSACSSSLPASWQAMSAPWQDVELVELAACAPEFTEVSDLFHATCSPAEWRIAKIERVQNLPQMHLYETHKRTIEARNRQHGANEKRLFHGTTKATIPKINRNSFNRSYCGKNATAYGKGVYFAVKASYSIDETYSCPDEQGNKYMYLARVAVGEFCKGKSSMTVPPPQPGTGDLLPYDTTVNNEGQPEMYVAYHDAQAYPEYLITIRHQ
jgi:serine/threonine protein kinase